MFQRLVTDLQKANTIPVAIVVQAKGDGLGVTMHSMRRHLHQATTYIAQLQPPPIFIWSDILPFGAKYV